MGIFKRLQWGQFEAIKPSKLNNMVQNDDYLHEHMITGVYETSGFLRETGLQCRAGRIRIPNTPAAGNFIRFTYPKPFAPGVKPIVTVTTSTATHWAWFSAIRNLDGSAMPGHDGFEVLLWQMVNPIFSEYQGEQYMNYIAIAPSAA